MSDERNRGCHYELGAAESKRASAADEPLPVLPDWIDIPPPASPISLASSGFARHIDDLLDLESKHFVRNHENTREDNLAIAQLLRRTIKSIAVQAQHAANHIEDQRRAIAEVLRRDDKTLKQALASASCPISRRAVESIRQRFPRVQAFNRRTSANKRAIDQDLKELTKIASKRACRHCVARFVADSDEEDG